MISEGTKNRAVYTLAAVAGLGVFPLFSGCMTLEEMAPPVGLELQTVGARHNVEVETLELGRKIYLSDCVKCHGVEPIGRYTVEKWRSMLPKMSDKTLLDGESARALETYVTLAHVLLVETAKTESGITRNLEPTSGDSVLGAYSTHGGG